MPFTRIALALVWLMVLGLFVLSASGAIAAKDGLMWLVLGGLGTPATILTLAARMRRSPGVVVPGEAGSVATLDLRDEMR